jgi:hypothetical protein
LGSYAKIGAVGELEDVIARQQQQAARQGREAREKIEAGRRLLDEFVTLMKRNGKTPILVFLEERQDLGMTKKFMQGTVSRRLISYSLLGEGWAVDEDTGLRTNWNYYYVPERGIARALPESAALPGIERDGKKSDRITFEYETRVPREMPPPATKIARASTAPEEYPLAQYAYRADDLARRAANILGG